MFQLFQTSLHFAVQELKERCWFWYKKFIVFCVKLFLITLLLIFIPSLSFALGMGGVSPILWLFLLPGIFGFCLYHLIKKILQFMADLFATTLHAAHDQNPQKLVSTQSNSLFLWIFLILSIPVLVSKHLIMVQTGSKILGALFFLIMLVVISVRLHFAYFITLENLTSADSTNADSPFQIVFASLKQSLRLTRGKFWQLLFIILLNQAFFILFAVIQAFDLAHFWSRTTVGWLFGIGILLSLLVTPLSMLMFARSYVLLSQEK